MNLTAFAIEKKTLTYFCTFLMVVGGTWSYFQLGRLEDPDFTVKTGIVVTRYPGASPEQVELEVTDRIERAIQEMPQLDNLYSLSRAGLSIVRVEMKQEYWADRLPQVWDEMRKKIRDIRPTLPPGAEKPEIVDDFSFVYGFVLAVSSDGYSYAELVEYVKKLKKDLSLVSGVARVETWGEQPKVIYLDVSEAQVAELGVSAEDVIATLATQNAVVNAGAVEVPGRRFRIEASGEFDAVEEIGEVRIRQSILDQVRNVTRELTPWSSPAERSSELIAIKDIAEVRRGYLEPPITRMRFNGRPAIAISLANNTGENIVKIGEAIDKRLNELRADLPAGIEVEKLAWQSDLVRASVDGFIISLLESVLIVIVVLTITMGWRPGVVVGSALLVTILATFIVMLALDVKLQRVSLGAFVIALGMLVDNAIVIVDNMTVRLGRGMDPKEAAIESAQGPKWSLLGATIVAVMAFFPTFFSQTDGGEYGRTLFIVVGISLMISWLLAMTITPMQCIALLKPPKSDATQEDPYGGRFFRMFRAFVEGAIRRRFLTIGSLVALLAVSIFGFQFVDRQFFPYSTRTQFMIDLWAPEGTPIQQVSADLARIEEKLLDDPRVKNIGTFVGAGGPRFYLPVDPELPWPTYGQLVVNTNVLEDVRSLIDELQPWVREEFPQSMVRLREYTVGPSDTWPFELRITGPGNADLQTLRKIGDQGMAILNATPLAREVRTDMRQRSQKVVVDYNQERARWSVVSRHDVANATQRAYDGLPVGLYRERDDMVQIIASNIDAERERAAESLDVLRVQPTLTMKSVPLSQVTQDIRLEWEDPIIPRWNRRREVAIQAQPNNTTFPALQAEVMEEIQAMELPPGYEMYWDGEAKSTREAQWGLVPGIVPGIMVMVVIIVALFNEIRPPLIMALLLPFAMIGITAILLATGVPFNFMALLGAISLVGMMIKNSIVLLDEVRLKLGTGLSPYEATVTAAVSRVRPVSLAALTTVLGVAPLVQDVFWVAMAFTIMAGLTLGTVLTMVLVPVLIAILYRIPSPEKSSAE